jgi:phosphatidylserine decarboxylase
LNLATFAIAQVLRIVPRARVSQAVGRLCDTPVPASVSRWATRLYVRAYRVDLTECEALSSPAYPNFNDFFTRRLKPGARPIAGAALVSPADGKLEASGPVEENGRLLVKGRPYQVGELIGDVNDARRYAGGRFAVIYLSPSDYHRVHSPVDGQLTLVRSLAGDRYPVNSIGERHVPDLFVRNQRVALAIDTPNLGRVTVVMVGAIIAGRITVTALGGDDTLPGVYPIDNSKGKVARGDEIGVFRLGSTAVLLVEPHVALSRSLGPIQYGQDLSSG